jgi:hypothetical protein
VDWKVSLMHLRHQFNSYNLIHTTNTSHVSHMSYYYFDASYVLMRNKLEKTIVLHVGPHHKRSKTCV